MEELLNELIQEQKKTNELLAYCYNGKDPNELLTVEQVMKETGIGRVTVLRMFNDPKLNAQRYTHPFLVSRQALNNYFNENHDYLIRKE